MLFLKVEWVILGFILCISGEKERSICVLKGSSVNLTCFAENSAASKSWYTVTENNHTFVLKELSANVIYNITEDGTLTIRDVKKSDDYRYCCRDSSISPEQCWEKRTELHAADLQVKVFPATEGQKVNLMCTTSCSLTESPAAFIWYKNTEFLHEDWSPWYQELVSRDQAVRYSCAIKGYEDLRAPEVSVDFINPDCFGVTYQKGDECPKKLKSANASCSVMYPREVGLHFEVISGKDFATLTCNTSCPDADSHTAFRWYWNKRVLMDCTSQDITVFRSFPYISCAVKNNEYLHSDEISSDGDCANVNYVSRRFCMLEGSSLNISSKYSKPSCFYRSSAVWYKLKRSMNMEADVIEMKDGDHVEYHSTTENQHTLRIDNLRKNDSGEYMFNLNKYEKCQQPDLPGVILVVTGLKVTIIPSDVVTEGQRVTLTCSTSCPLTEKTTYLWFFNEQPLNLSGNHNKHVILNPVRSWHAGNYSCAIRTPQSISSTLEALNVKGDKTMTWINIAKLAFLILFLLVGCKWYLMLRKRKTGNPTVKQSKREETEEVTTHYESLTLRARNPHAEGEQEELQESPV